MLSNGICYMAMGVIDENSTRTPRYFAQTLRRAAVDLKHNRVTLHETPRASLNIS